MHVLGAAAARALHVVPVANSRVVAGRLVPFDDVSVAFAVDVGRGTDLAPLKVRGADRLSPAEIALQVRRGVSALRSGDDAAWRRSTRAAAAVPAPLLRPVLAGASFLLGGLGLPMLGQPGHPLGAVFISNLAPLGLEEAFLAPVPFARAHVYIALGTVSERPVVRDGQVVPVRQFTLCLTGDHRIVDGAQCARYLSALLELLAAPERLDAPPVPPVTDALGAELRREQEHLDRATARLEELRARAVRSERASLARDQGGNPQSLYERDVQALAAAARRSDLDLAGEGLVFGRLDLGDGTVHHIGRLGLRTEDQEPIVVDWRAPAAAAFYRATSADPGGVVRRRTITTRGATVRGLEDELLDPDGAEHLAGTTVVGDGAFLAAVSRERGPRMRDIVATIQREQDEAVRAPDDGALVVTGGPGTGKTAVALHRVAYLMYARRDWYARRGVLVVGRPRCSSTTSARCSRRWVRPACGCPAWVACRSCRPASW